MKKCPVCGTKYADSKEFCELDRALLEPCEEKEETKEVPPAEPFNRKRLIVACLYACGFIGFIFLLYFILGGGFR